MGAEQEENPAQAQEGWDNDTSLHAALQQWGASFCRVHHVGYFCNRYTRVRCCRTGWATACAAPRCIRTVVAGMLVVGMLADGMLEAGTLTRPKTRQMMSRQKSSRHPVPSRSRTQSQPRRVGTMTPACTRPSSSGVHLSVGCTMSATSAIDTLE